MKILYVEDDDATASTVELMLKQAGHVCETTASGKEAVHLAKHNRYDLILLDIMLPDIDGYEVIQQLRSAGVETPFLIQSGLLDRDHLADGVSFGAANFLVKPFNRAELLERLEKAGIPFEKSEPETPTYQPDPEPVTQNRTERRQRRRFKTLKSAKVIGAENFDCLVVNLSYSGAAIRLPSADMDCPEKFVLSLQSGPVHRCQVCWRHDDKVGVKFI